MTICSNSELFVKRLLFTTEKHKSRTVDTVIICIFNNYIELVPGGSLASVCVCVCVCVYVCVCVCVCVVVLSLGSGSNPCFVCVSDYSVVNRS